jgi:hypothetical protein
MSYSATDAESIAAPARDECSGVLRQPSSASAPLVPVEEFAALVVRSATYPYRDIVMCVKTLLSVDLLGCLSVHPPVLA